MARRKEEKEGYGRLLDAWMPPADAGEPIGCIATTYTFSPAFFEEECLARFLNLESDPDEDGPLHLVEREEKLAQLKCAAVLVDARHCRGIRSLRWDLLPARTGGGVMHAKISLLCWSRRIRLIVASANLTEDGYRRNQEIFGVLDFHEQSEMPPDCLRAVMAFLRRLAQKSRPATAPELGRWLGLLDSAESFLAGWEADPNAQRRRSWRIHPVFVESGGKPAFEQISALWPDATPPRAAWIVSPFFDPPGARNEPAHKIWELLRRRGEAEVNYVVLCQEPPADGPTLVQAPREILFSPPGRPGVDVHIERLELELSRPLHAKNIWLDGARWSGSMIGSSNFTSAGLGLMPECNVEANLVYLVDRERDSESATRMERGLLRGNRLNLDADLAWQAAIDQDEATADVAALPVAFSSAIYRLGAAGQPVIQLNFEGAPPAGWRLYVEDGDELLLCEDRWVGMDSPQSVEVVWKYDRPPTGMTVTWAAAEAKAWWPVVAESRSVLPPPEELRGLSLEVLIEILTSARPLHRVLELYLRRHRRKAPGAESVEEIDPHAKVDTSRFLLQRTRQISWALEALRARLQCPAATRECLEWRLRGPVGVGALIEALRREAHSPEEELFLKAELALELRRVQPADSRGALPARTVRNEIDQLIKEIEDGIDLAVLPAADPLRGYIKLVFGDARS